jgi:hypothetical protein
MVSALCVIVHYAWSGAQARAWEASIP